MSLRVKHKHLIITTPTSILLYARFLMLRVNKLPKYDLRFGGDAIPPYLWQFIPSE
jgi:hypothetical protein